jgi:hypothetical protein
MASGRIAFVDCAFRNLIFHEIRAGTHFHAYASSDCGSTAAHKVNDENHKRHHKQQVDQAAGHVETETEKPKNQKHYENRPKHIYSPLLIFES